MKKSLLSLAIMLLIFNSFSQNMYRPSEAEISMLPDWAREMYSSDPNVWRVDSLYLAYYATNPFVKSYHTQYYKRWHRNIDSWVNEQGFIRKPGDDARKAMDNEYLQMISGKGKAGQWSLVGPVQAKNANGANVGSQTNVYTIDRCDANPSVLYCGTEPGEVYKSTDHGMNWGNASMGYDMGGGVTALEADPFNTEIVFAGSNNKLMKSIDGAATWNTVIQLTDLGVNEILINPGNTQVVLAATNKGLYQSTDGGNTFTNLFTEKCYDLKCKPGSPATVYLLKNNPLLLRAEFFLSQDMGATWNLKDQGWYSSADPNRNDGGARLAVTPADPNRVYAYLIGEAKANDYGYIGVYRSDDGGESWILPNPPAGGPYTSAHPNLAYGNPGWTYHQGFYNCAIMASSSNADHILVGGLNLWRSEDGGQTFTAQGGYQGNILDIHVDQQDFRAFGDEYWISNDGGIYWSDDFFSPTNAVKTRGIHGSDYWGFGSGWNEDILVGGLYHNGNLAWYQDYDDGDFLSLGGGEAPTGYVNPAEGRKTYFSDIGGKILPEQIGDPVGNFSFGLSPNESYWSAESSELEFYPYCYNIIYLGKDNKLWRSTDGGTSFNLVYEFGTNINNQVKYIEISRSNPQVIYVTQQPQSGTNGTLWKTSDGGVSWTALTKPAGSSRRMLISLSPEDENILWLAYPGGGNNLKIYKTTNGGQNWTNLTSATLSNEEAHSISCIGGTQGGIYYAGNRSVFYRNDTMSDWTVFNAGLPAWFNSDIARPFYRDGKIRIASYGKGIWESPLFEQPARPIAQITVNRLESVYHCVLDTFSFDDYSMLNHAGASWQWSFPGGNPSQSGIRNPQVVYTNPGNYLVTLTVTDSSGQSDTDSLYISVSNFSPPPMIYESFEGEFPPYGWDIVNPQGDGTWSVSNDAGGFGNTPRSAIFDNFDIDSHGQSDDLSLSVDLSGTNTAKLVFDVAYAPYGGQYSDTLEIWVSTDCGQSFTKIYDKGGVELSTAPANNNFFTPSASEWRTDTLELAQYIGNDDVNIAFRNIGHWGNNIYLDNARVVTLASSVNEVHPQPASVNIYPNPAIAGGQIHLASSTSEDFTLTFYNLQGKEISRLKTKPGENFMLDPNSFAPGTYFFVVKGKTVLRRGNLVVMKGRRQ
ncbi:MAG: PKD domain-containing protein [Bacteroidales bacterium]